MSRDTALPTLMMLLLIPLCAKAQDTLRLELERAVRLDGGGAYNLSGMALGADGYLYFTDDNGPAPTDWEPLNGVFLRIKLDELLDSGNETPVLETLEVAGGGKTFAALADSCGKGFKYDLEGVAVLDDGKLWACDERDRLLLEFDPVKRTLRQVAGYRELAAGDDRLAAGRINNGFEGIAVTGSRLFLAHEMYPNLIVRYTLAGGKVAMDSVLEIKGSSDITSLESDGGALYALGRTGSLVYRLDPASGNVTAVASFGREADNPAYRYRQQMDYFRNSEGLAVGHERIFIVLDGNFQTGLDNENERRPLLLIYKRPKGF